MLPIEQLDPSSPLIMLVAHKWSATPHIPLYLFFGGLAAGIFIVAAICDLVSLKAPRFEAVAKAAGYLAFPMAALGGLFLSIHLGKPERGILFPLFFTNFESWMVIGAWILAPFMAVSAAYPALWFFGVDRRARIVVAIVGIPVAIGLAGYTGFLLAGQGFVPLWSQKYLPIMFLNSGITTGIALAGIATLVATQISLPLVGPIRLEDRDRSDVIRWLTLFMGIAILVESFELYSFMGYLTQKAKGGGVRRQCAHSRSPVVLVLGRGRRSGPGASIAPGRSELPDQAAHPGVSILLFRPGPVGRNDPPICHRVGGRVQAASRLSPLEVAL